MTTVVLLGCSGAGKSLILRQVERLVEARELPPVECLDSDREISTSDGGHIYDIHLRYGRLAATSLIDTRERAFLDSLQATDTPRLIAAGPALVSREPQFSRFVNRVKPGFVYLEQTFEAVLEALKRRRERHSASPELANDPGFGSWDWGIRTTRRNDGTFAVVPDAVAIANVERECSPLVSVFERLTPTGSRHSALVGPDDASLLRVVQHVAALLSEPAETDS